MSDSREYYSTYWERTGYLGTTRTGRALERQLRRVSGAGACLDVGCGDGGTAGVWLAGHTDHYVGVDISLSAVEACRERGLDARLIEDAASLPFEADSFDLVTSIEVLEHLFNPAAALAEVSRVLKPGGTLLVTVPNIAHWRVRTDLALGGRWIGRGDYSSTEPWLDPHIRFFTIRSLPWLLESAGFRVDSLTGLSERGLLQNVPGLRRLARPEAGHAMRALNRLRPGLFALHLCAIARST